jgi:putative tryptophan/tyrosine transport system substrate-binding protein
MISKLKWGIIIALIILGTIGLLPLRAADRVVISVVYSSDIDPYQQCWDGFKTSLTEKNVALWVSKYSLKEQSPEKIIPQISAEKPQVIFALGTKAQRMARLSFRTIPIVYALVLEPEDVKDPNMTGVLMDIPAKMRVNEIRRICPDRKRFGIIYSEESATKAVEIVQYCFELGLSVNARKVTSEKELPDALTEMVNKKIDCFIMVPDTRIYFPQSVKYLLQESIKNKFPVIGLSRFYTKDGALLSFDCDYPDLGRQAAELTLQILNGAKPESLKPVNPRKTDVSLNTAIAEKIGVKMSQDIIKEAVYLYGENSK